MNPRLIYIIFIIPLLILVSLRFGFGFDGLYGQDSYEYMRYSTSLKKYLTDGTPPGDYFWPVAYPLTGALLSFLIPNITLSLQIISAISLSVVSIFTVKIIRIIYPEKNKALTIFVAFLIILTPFVLRFGLSVMADMFTLATFISGTYYVLLFSKKNKTIFLVGAAALYSMSFMSRYAAIVIMIPFIIFAMFLFFKTKQTFYYIFIIALVAVIPIIPHYLIRNNDPVGFINHNWILSWSPINFVKRSFTTADGTQNNAFPNIIYTFFGFFHPRYFCIAVIISIIGIKRFKWKNENILILTSVVLYFLFLSGIPYQNNRFLLLAFPLFLLIYCGPIEYLLGLFYKKRSLFIIVPVLLIQITLFGFSFKKVIERLVLEKDIFTYLKNQRINAIYTMDVDISLKGRGYDGTVYNIFTNYYDSIDTNAVIIFNTTVFPKQWENKNPMKNWNHFNQNYQLKEVTSFDKEWKAYVFK